MPAPPSTGSPHHPASAEAARPAASPFAASPLPDLAKARALLHRLNPDERLVVLLADQFSRGRPVGPPPATAPPALTETPEGRVYLGFQELCRRALTGEGPPDWAAWQERFPSCSEPM